jgi:HD-GYP domain-containing protein (c-di-GMP phosphodiesterase class II)
MTENGQIIKSLLVMASFVEARDPYTGGHLWRVSQYARLLGSASQATRQQQALAELGGFIHDIGKISLPDNVLGKPGKLTEGEYEIIKTHPAVGARMLQRHPLASFALDAVIGHHEMPSGRGYPQGLEGLEIPWVSRVVGICDAFDAMTSTRSYRQGMSIQKALEIIQMNAGTQFDHDLANQFLELGHKGYLTHIVGHSEDGIPLLTCPKCGPTIVIPSNSREGETLYCRVCGGEALLHWKGDDATLQFTGISGSPQAMTHHPEMDLIENMTEDLAPVLL